MNDIIITRLDCRSLDLCFIRGVTLDCWCINRLELITVWCPSLPSRLLGDQVLGPGPTKCYILIIVRLSRPLLWALAINVVDSFSNLLTILSRFSGVVEVHIVNLVNLIIIIKDKVLAIGFITN